MINPCSDQDLKFLGEKPPSLFSQCSHFVDKIREIVGINEKEMGREKIKCLFFGPNWVYIMNKCP